MHNYPNDDLYDYESDFDSFAEINTYWTDFVQLATRLSRENEEAQS